MKIEKLNENLDHIEIADKTYDVVNHTYATAVRDHKSNVERITKMMKERSKDAVQGERQPKTIKNAMLKRLHLSESIFDNIRPLGKQKVHEAKERIWTYDTEDGEEWYDMASFIEDHLSRSDITRPDEQVLNRIARISDTQGVSYKNLGRDKNDWVTARVPLGKYSEDTDEIEISDSEETQANAKARADKVIEAAHKIAEMYKLGFDANKNADEKFYEFKIEVPKDSIGQVYCIGDWFEENGLDLDMALTPAYQKRLAKREQLFANPDKNEKFIGKAKNEALKENREDFWLIETSEGIYKVNGKTALFDTQADADNFIDSNDLEGAVVMFADEDDIKSGHKMNESLTEDLKYGQTKYEELVGKIREYWDAPAIDNLCDLMKDIDEQAAYDLIYKCAEFLEEHADEAIEDSQKYPIEKPKAKDSTFVSAKDKQPKKYLLTEKDKVDESVIMNEEAKIITSLEDYVPWGGAADTWDRISDEDKIEELDNLLENAYPEGISLTDLNDLLWFEQDWVFEELGIVEDEDDED